MTESVGDRDSTVTLDHVQLPIPALSPVKVGKTRSNTGYFETGKTVCDHQHVASNEAESAHMDAMKKTPTAPRPTAWDKHSNGDEERIESRDDTLSKRSVGKTSSARSGPAERHKTVKLSSEKIQDFTSSPLSLSLRAATPTPDFPLPVPDSLSSNGDAVRTINIHSWPPDQVKDVALNGVMEADGDIINHSRTSPVESNHFLNPSSSALIPRRSRGTRPDFSTRAVSTPAVLHKDHSSRRPRDVQPRHLSCSKSMLAKPAPSNRQERKLNEANGSAVLKPPTSGRSVASPKSHSLPLPPLSLATYLQLELSSDRPSPLYIHIDPRTDAPSESSRVKFERLLNFLLLPPELEQIFWFGALACLDAWLYTFTILPLRFVKASVLFIAWWARNAMKEAHDLASSVCRAFAKIWRRGLGRHVAIVPSTHSRSRSATFPQPKASSSVYPGDEIGDRAFTEQQRRHRRSTTYRHRRTKSTPSLLMPSHKADLLKGCLIVGSCAVLMRFDASRMYHGIRGQAAIKLYVIYNVLEVCDRLFSALGQDILECLFSRETLERDSDGRSRISRPFWMFLLALAYTVTHSTALFYQVITLNVAVNSYSNALLTLLMSNQFVEIKGTVFKKFEKENLFQVTCADVVERFQLWLMLTIIALRNIVEVGGLSISSGAPTGDFNTSASFLSNATKFPLRTGGILPKSFTIFPRWTGQVLGPFLLVLGSETLVDWLKHAYITKFNNMKPAIYGRFLDVLAKDYYSNAFEEQNLTKRLGLPVIPLSCLFIRASIQTYRMFLATYMPLPLPSTATSLSLDSASAATSPGTTAALAHIHQVFRRAVGRSTFGAGGPASDSGWWSLDDIIAFATIILFFLMAYFVLLAFKLVLGICLLSFARKRYIGMKEREKEVVDTKGTRVGGWGVIEVDDAKKRWIYHDDPDGLKASLERERKAQDREGKTDINLGAVSRYSMATKRIW